jgi:hypothetical protein
MPAQRVDPAVTAATSLHLQAAGQTDLLMPAQRNTPSLLGISIAWSLIIAAIMTAITFLHRTPGEVTAAGGALGLGQVGILFLAWFLAAEVTLVVGGALYLGANVLLRRGRNGGR